MIKSWIGDENSFGDKMQVSVNNVTRRLWTGSWWVMMTVMILMSVVEVISLNGPNVCVVEQKYNVTKRVKYRAPMAVRTYEWCFAMPPRCSHWTTEMKDLTRLENEERTAEVAVCCPGYKMRDVSCVPICPHGKTGHGCSKDCPPNKWGPNCVNTCKACSERGKCSPITGECQCQEGWQGERCELSMLLATSTAKVTESLLTTTKTSPVLTLTTTEATTPNVSIKYTTTLVPVTTPNTTTSSSVKLTRTELSATLNTVTPKINSMVAETLIPSTRIGESKGFFNNDTITTSPVTTNIFKETTVPYISRQIFNLSEIETSATSGLTKSTESFTSKTIPEITSTKGTTMFVSTMSKLETTATEKEIVKTDNTETTKKAETTVKMYPTTVKFRPKEIWIKPTQKGESTIVETKFKPTHELSLLKYIKNTTKKDLSSTTTTPRTIIVSIIPTSMSYSTFKKISLTTASSLNAQQQRYPSYQQTFVDRGVTKSTSNHSTSTTTPFTIKILNAVTSKRKNSSSAVSPLHIIPITSTKSYTSQSTATAPSVKTTKSVFTLGNTINSMSGMKVVNKTTFSSQYSSVTSAPSSPTVSPTKRILSSSSETIIITSTNMNKPKPLPEATSTKIQLETTPLHPSVIKHHVTVKQGKNLSDKNVDVVKDLVTKLSPLVRENNSTGAIEVTNVTQKLNKATTTARTNDVEFTSSTNTLTTTDAEDEEAFNVLTEPEHITAVIDDKSSKTSSLDLISVISIAGGVMMTVITVAVIIVMIERCRRPNYEGLRKVNDIRMKVVMENNDEPPPYVRSIFHTPLPEPPITDKCHYQPISTLDRNLKQFMRPVVVQTISPLMLENFRGILECHYDHLPAQRRSYNFGASERDTRCSLAPSVGCCSEPLCPRPVSVTDSTIDALKCEAHMDVIDSTTSEPLYAEIPCWRPPSEHAIEIVNINGEAVTEL